MAARRVCVRVCVCVGQARVCVPAINTRGGHGSESDRSRHGWWCLQRPPVLLRHAPSRR